MLSLKESSPEALEFPPPMEALTQRKTASVGKYPTSTVGEILRSLPHSPSEAPRGREPHLSPAVTYSVMHPLLALLLSLPYFPPLSLCSLGSPPNFYPSHGLRVCLGGPRIEKTTTTTTAMFVSSGTPCFKTKRLQ